MHLARLILLILGVLGSGSPLGYEISSTGGAKAKYPELMGIYKLTGDTHNSFPTYKHENGEYYLYVNDEPYDDWIVSTSGYENTASLFANKPSDQSGTPTVGWKYFNNGWQSDPTMRVFRHNEKDADPRSDCMTDSGASPDKPCIFPFKFAGQTYNQCTWVASTLTENKPWCSTMVDESGEHIGRNGRWGYCAPGCPRAVDDRKRDGSVTEATSLTSALKNNNIDLARELLADNETDVNKPNEDGETPLFIASSNGQLEFVKIILNTNEGKLSLNQADSVAGDTPLIRALWNLQIDVAKQLLNFDEIDVNKSTKQGETPLFVASINGLIEIVRILLITPEGKLSLNAALLMTGATPLIAATRNNHVGIVRELLSFNQTDVNKPNNEGETPLLVASKNGNGELVKMLLNSDEGKLSLNQASPETGATPLLEALENNHTDVAIELLSYNETDVNKPNKDGETPLFVASKNGQAKVVLLLLSKEARMPLNTAETRTGSTPRIAAIMNNQSDVVRELLSYNETDVNKTHKSRETPVDVANFEGNTEISELLVDADADAVLSKAAMYGLTPLYWLQTLLIYSLILACN